MDLKNEKPNSEIYQLTPLTKIEPLKMMKIKNSVNSFEIESSVAVFI